MASNPSITKCEVCGADVSNGTHVRPQRQRPVSMAHALFDGCTSCHAQVVLKRVDGTDYYRAYDASGDHRPHVCVGRSGGGHVWVSAGLPRS